MIETLFILIFWLIGIKLLNPKSTQKSRIIVLFAGKGWISEDFNEPLPDDYESYKLINQAQYLG